MSQRRSKPVNGSVLAFVLVAGLELTFSGSVWLLGVVGFSDSFDGNVPVFGVVVVVVVAGVVVVVVLGLLGSWL